MCRIKTNKGWRNTEELASRGELPALALQEKRERAVNQDPVSTVVFADMSPSGGCGFLRGPQILRNHCKQRLEA